MAIYKDYVGLNICIYDPIEADFGCRRATQKTSGNPKDYSTGSMTIRGQLKYIEDYSDHEFSPAIRSISKDAFGKSPSQGQFYGQDYWANLQGYLVPGLNNIVVKQSYSTQSYNDPPDANSNTSVLTMPNRTSKVAVLLNLHRNGPYGYGSWKQVRASKNPLIRFQKRHSVFTFVKSPGNTYVRRDVGKYIQQQDRNSSIIRTTEPGVHGNQYPLQLIAGINFHDDESTDPDEISTKGVELKMSFGNETVFFANNKNNLFFNTISETDENYENLKDLYLNGALERDDSPIDEFTLLNYKQTIFPKQRYAYLNRTRSRIYFINRFWNNSRTDRDQTPVSNPIMRGFHPDTVIMRQSKWPLDADVDFKEYGAATKTTSDEVDTYAYRIGGRPFKGGFGAQDGSGILQNTYNRYMRGGYLNKYLNPSPRTPYPGSPGTGSTFVDYSKLSNFLTAACGYSILHTWPSILSTTSPSGMRNIAEYNNDNVETNPLPPYYQYLTLPTASLFRGLAAWDAPAQSGKAPFYETYQDYNQDIKLKGQGYSIVPEFRISSHVKEYQTLGVTEELSSIFELSGAYHKQYTPVGAKYPTPSHVFYEDVNATTEKKDDFYEVLSTSDFLKHFDLIQKDHNGFVDPKLITLRCKAIKKFLPYEGFYPAQRTVDISRQFYDSYSDNIKFVITASGGGSSNSDKFAPQFIMNPLFSPGVLFNSIKSGVAVDYPICSPQDKMSSPQGWDPVGIKCDNAYNQQPNYLLENEGFMVDGTTPRADVKTFYTQRVPFEALVQPERYLANRNIGPTDPHPFALGRTSALDNGNNSRGKGQFQVYSQWNGIGDSLYKKMVHNFLAEVPNFFLRDQSFSTISSLESQDPNFGNAVSGSFYTMRIKMNRSTDGRNKSVLGFGRTALQTPQDIVIVDSSDLLQVNSGESRIENFTMYSRPTAFGPPSAADGESGFYSSLSEVQFESGSSEKYKIHGLGSPLGTNYPYTPPYYHGDAYCDLIFECTESKKYTVDEILSSVKEYPYYTRWWWPDENDAFRDLTGYRNDYPTGTLGSNPAPYGYIAQIPEINGPYSDYAGGPWDRLIRKGKIKVAGPYTPHHSRLKWADGPWPVNPDDGHTQIALRPYSTDEETGRWTDGWEYGTGSYKAHRYASGTKWGPQSPTLLNANALQLNSTLNLFGKAIIKERTSQADESQLITEVANSETNDAKSRWVIQTKFETPILNFNSYTNLSQSSCTTTHVGGEQVPRGMWHQYGLDDDPAKGIFMQVSDIPKEWLKGALGIGYPLQDKKVKSLKDLCGFSSDPIKLGQAATVKQIGEVVAAVPFVEKNGLRKFFTIPREDIDEVIASLRREVSPGVFVAGGAPSSGLSVVNMVKMMKKYVFPPSMDFVKYPQIQPFAMYLFEFTHNFTKQDLTDMWQNLSPKIGTSFEESEVSISHELLASELLGGGVQKNTISEKGDVNTSAEAPPVPSEVQWMIFKVKQRAESNYFDKVVQNVSTTTPLKKRLAKVQSPKTGEKYDITYNWPYDFFSLVELVKIDAEVSFAKTEEVGQDARQISTIKRKTKRVPSLVRKAFGKKR